MRRSVIIGAPLAAIGTMAGVLAVGTQVASAGLSGKCGNAAVVFDPPSVTVGSLESSDQFRVFAERQDVTLASPLAIDASAPGTYSHEADLVAGTIGSGTKVSSFMLHSDPVGTPPGNILTARLNFTSDILGVVVGDANLDASDAIVGLATTTYPTGRENRRVELSVPAGNFTIEPDHRSFDITVRTSSLVDQIRVIVAGDAPGSAINTGYRFASAAGQVWSYGGLPAVNPPDLPSLGITHLNGAITQGVGTCSDKGYWLVGADGGVFSFGDALFHGSMGATGTTHKSVAIARTNTDEGYWFTTAIGEVFPYGDAGSYGDLPTLHVNPVKPVHGMSSTQSGHGYWLFAEDGGLFAFGDAGFYGSVPGLLGTTNIPSPVVGMAPTFTGKGYWMTTADGNVYAFGDAPDKGSLKSLGIVPNKPIIAIRPTPTGEGYYLFGEDGGVFSFGDADFFGSQGGTPPPSPVVAVLS